jgi:hypothetical protein
VQAVRQSEIRKLDEIGLVLNILAIRIEQLSLENPAFGLEYCMTYKAIGCSNPSGRDQSTHRLAFVAKSTQRS